ncbi:MAG: 30S ribosomal protein S9 [Anaerolineae bacterium]|nr:30S ribosomal protein S9 [Anaerolineae bacterium]
MSTQYFEGVGRRKSATARVRIYPGGSGEVVVNDKALNEYFPREGDVTALMEPLEVSEMQGGLDMTVVVKGGGITGQTGAVRLGLARALIKYQPELRPVMRRAGLLTRDAREKERKKPGLKRARKAPTYTKR